MDNNIEYLILGYGLAFFLLASIIVSIWWRHRILTKDEAALESLEKELQEERSGRR
jgi:hypothetical protein